MAITTCNMAATVCQTNSLQYEFSGKLLRLLKGFTEIKNGETQSYHVLHPLPQTASLLPKTLLRDTCVTSSWKTSNSKDSLDKLFSTLQSVSAGELSI